MKYNSVIVWTYDYSLLGQRLRDLVNYYLQEVMRLTNADDVSIASMSCMGNKGQISIFSILRLC